MTGVKLTAKEVLRRYNEENLPAFCNANLTDVNQVGLFGERPLCVAAVRGEVDDIRALLEGGAVIDAPGESGNTALHEALMQNKSAAAIFLLEAGAKTDIKNDFGKTALDMFDARDGAELLHRLKGYK